MKNLHKINPIPTDEKILATLWVLQGYGETIRFDGKRYYYKTNSNKKYYVDQESPGFKASALTNWIGAGEPQLWNRIIAE